MAIVAPTEIAPGESVQLIAHAVKSDGSVEDVSSQVVWSLSSTTSLQLSPTGLATGVERGDAEVVARLTPKLPHANKWFFVVPKGTFVLSGTTHEQGVLIPNVTVQVISGTGQGLSTESNSGGFFRLYGVAGSVQLELNKEGFLRASPQLNVSAHMTRHFDVVSERLRDDYDGAYTLTISAASDCDGVRRLPDEARRREYIATVTRNGAHLAVTLSGADFLVSNGRGNSFTGQLFTYERINFKISDATWDEYGLFESGSFDIAERVSESTVVFSGSAAVQKTGAGFSGTFGGTIAASGNAVPPFAPFTATCESSHTFEMVRR